MLRLRVSRPIAKQQFDSLASQFEAIYQEALAAKTLQIDDLRSRYGDQVKKATRILEQSFADVEDTNLKLFRAAVNLNLEPEPSRLAERTAIRNAAHEGNRTLAEWVRELESE